MNFNDYTQFDNIITQFTSAIEAGRVAHFYIIEASHNIDKLGFAKSMAKALTCTETVYGCNECDACKKIDSGVSDGVYVLPNSDKAIGVADISELIDELMFRPIYSEYKTVIIDADYMKAVSENKLLKTLEEPLGKTIIILLTSNTSKLLKTTLSRAVIYRLGADDSLDEVHLDKARILLEMSINGSFWYEICDKCSELIDSKIEAIKCLQAMQELLVSVKKNKQYQSSLRQYNYVVRNISSKQLICWGQFIKEALKEIEYEPRYSNVMKSLLLKIGGIDENDSWS